MFSHHAVGKNPLCGDALEIFLATAETSQPTLTTQQVHDAELSKHDVDPPKDAEPYRIEDAFFDGSGCALMTASASILMTILEGASIVQAQAYVADFLWQLEQRVLREPDPAPCLPESFAEEITALLAVRAHPARIKCVSLPWMACWAALEQNSNTISTEA